MEWRLPGCDGGTVSEAGAPIGPRDAAMAAAVSASSSPFLCVALGSSLKEAGGDLSGRGGWAVAACMRCCGPGTGTGTGAGTGTCTGTGTDDCPGTCTGSATGTGSLALVPASAQLAVDWAQLPHRSRWNGGALALNVPDAGGGGGSRLRGIPRWPWSYSHRTPYHSPMPLIPRKRRSGAICSVGEVGRPWRLQLCWRRG